MKLAILGADNDALALAEWAVGQRASELVAAYECGSLARALHRLAPHAQQSENWEALLLGSLADAVIVGRGDGSQLDATGLPAADRRADQLRKLVQAAVPLIVVCPACEAIVGFEIEMIRRDTGAILVPHVPGCGHWLLRELAESAALGAAGPIGSVEQVVLEREQADRSRAAVLTRLARDLALLRRLVGPIRAVSASGAPALVGRDPLGPKLKEPPSLANLSVSLAGEFGIAARWFVAPAAGADGGRLIVIGSQGKAVLHMPGAGGWSLEIAGRVVRQAADSGPSDVMETFSQLANALAGKGEPDSAWLAVCRDQEAAEAVDRSLERGRTIELFAAEHTEAESFKGIMAMGGCLLLLLALGVLFLVVVVEGLHIPIRGWRIWRLWPMLLLVPLATFLVLQLLQFVVRRAPAREPSTADHRSLAR